MAPLFALIMLGAAPWPDGSLLVLENGNKPVSGYTGSAVTHVGMIGVLAGEAWVYEATPARVRRMPLSRYVSEVRELNRHRKKRMRMSIMAPKEPYTNVQVARLHRYMDAQLGRRYSVKGYVRGRKGDGIHCAEFSSAALAATGRFRVVENQRLSPSKVIDQIRPWYAARQTISLDGPVTKRSWSSQMWNSVITLQAWCAWASYELWTLCW